MLFVVTSLRGIGGIENYILRFIDVYKNSLDITILCKLGITGEFASKFSDKGVKVISLGLKYFSIIHAFKFVSFLRKEQFYSICDFTGDFAGLVMFLGNIAKVEKRLVFYRSSKYQFDSSFFKNIYVAISKRLTKYYSTKILSNSRSALNYFHSNWEEEKENYEVIYNGITSSKGNITSFSQSLKKRFPEDRFLIGHVGNYRPVKNHQLIINVATEICKHRKNVYFVLAGKDLEENLGPIIRERNLEDKILIVGYLENIPELLSLLDLFIFPSFNEGQPNALLEAIVYGVSIVASKIPSILESVPESIHFCLKSANDTAGFVKVIEQVISEGSLYDVSEMQDWAKREYDPMMRFNQFYQELR